MTQASVAAASGLSRAAYRNIEAGAATPRVDSLVRIAAALGEPVDRLLAPAIQLHAVRFRASRLRSRAQVLAQVALWLQDYAQIERDLGEQGQFKLQRLVGTRGRRDPATVAMQARSELGLGDSETIRDICGLLEDRGCVRIYPLRLARDDFFGLSVAAGDLGPAIVVNVWERITVERWIFTAAHELGHLLLHGSAYDVTKTKEDRTEEQEANLFAGNFLMPREVFQQEWDATHGLSLVDRVLKVKRIFHVSWKAVLRSAFPGTKRMDRLFVAEYERRTGKRLGPKDEPQRLSHADFVTDRLDGLVRKAMSAKLVDEERAAEILGVTVEELKARVATWAQGA